MASCAVLMAEGYEEGETLTIVDILRRAGVICHTFSFQGNFVKGMHGMMVKADKYFGEEVKGYDMIVLPGGRPGGANLKDNPAVIAMVRYFDEQGKFVTAMCSGTTVLEEAQVIRGRNVTGYVGYAEKLPSGHFQDRVVVQDGKLITGQGPATVYPFAYRLAEALGADIGMIRTRMLYDFAGGKEYRD